MRIGTVVLQPSLDAPPHVTLDDPAVAAMTDLSRVPAVLVDPDVEIEAAMRIMILLCANTRSCDRGCE